MIWRPLHEAPFLKLLVNVHIVTLSGAHCWMSPITIDIPSSKYKSFFGDGILSNIWKGLLGLEGRVLKTSGKGCWFNPLMMFWTSTSWKNSNNKCVKKGHRQTYKQSHYFGSWLRKASDGVYKNAVTQDMQGPLSPNKKKRCYRKVGKFSGLITLELSPYCRNNSSYHKSNQFNPRLTIFNQKQMTKNKIGQA